MGEKIRGNQYQLFQKAVCLLPQIWYEEQMEDGTTREVRSVGAFNRSGDLRDKGKYTFVQERYKNDGRETRRYILVHDTFTHPIVRGVIFSKEGIETTVGYGPSEGKEETFMGKLLCGFLNADRFTTIGKKDTTGFFADNDTIAPETQKIKEQKVFEK